MHVPEIHDPALLDMPATLVDVFVTNRAFSGKTIRELADEPFARGVHLRRITRSMVEIPILPETEILRGDILTLAGSMSATSKRRSRRWASPIGRSSPPTSRPSPAASSSAAWSVRSPCNWGGIPIGLSTSGGALLAGLVLGYFRTIRPTFGRIPTPALALMNTLGLNVFIAIVGINAGPGFVAGLQQVGFSLFLWGIVATSVPLVLAVLLGHYVFKFHPAILFGVCAGVRTTTAALGMIQDAAQEQGSGARIRHALRHRQHAAHDLRHGRRADHEQVRLAGRATERRRR